MNQRAWRSLDELSDTPEFRATVTREFPGLDNFYESTNEAEGRGFDRRRFLQLMAASIGMMSLAGCRRPKHEILPYTRSPEEIVPGLPTYYATTFALAGTALGVLVESHEGRPTKIEGNPLHPFSRGATNTWAQASVLDLYDPDRSKFVLNRGQASTWAEFDEWSKGWTAGVLTSRGKGIRILAEPSASPAVRMLRDHLRRAAPLAVWHEFSVFDSQNTAEGARVAFDSLVAPLYRFDLSKIVLALDADPLGLDFDHVRHTADFAAKRRSPSMNRLYVVESSPTVTGAAADHRFRLSAGATGDFAIALSRVLRGEAQDQFSKAWLNAVAKDLKANAGKSIIIAGPRQPAWVHALVHQMNTQLGNHGATIEFRAVLPDDSKPLDDLVAAVRDRQVETLLVLGGNPVFESGGAPELAGVLGQVPTTIRLGLHVDETSSACQWHLPAAHYLEAWGDAEASDGTYSPIQPLIAPLYSGRSEIEVLAKLFGFDVSDGRDIVRKSFTLRSGKSQLAAFRRWLHEGVLADSRRPLVRPTLRSAEVDRAVAGRASNRVAEGFEVSFLPDRRLLDGRFANNAWMQELPDPITKLTWDTAVVISPADAQKLNASIGDVVRITVSDRSVDVPLFILPGQADGCATLSLGNGRRTTGRVGVGQGVDVYPLRAGRPLQTGARIVKTGKKTSLATTQEHGSMEGRDLVRVKKFGDESEHDSHHRIPLDLAAPPDFTGDHQWGMAIDLNSCTGCSACVVACQSENNVPVVGKAEVERGRIMHWLRLDRYFLGKPDEPTVVHQPVACVHCESAPCEPVCPVNASVHSPEGLNLQVYNRCLGTRYCSNNCPYKARRFNWFDYHQRSLADLRLGPLAEKGMPETLKMQKNPDVTVRMRGIMEKCTYCIQRIERGKLGVKIADANRPGPHLVPDGTIIPACQQACPAGAITFGNLMDSNSRVSALRRRHDSYLLLEELNTKPRTFFLPRTVNPNPDLIGEGAAS